MEKFLNGLTDAASGMLRVLINIVVGFSKRTLRKRYRWVLGISILTTFLFPVWCLYHGYASQGGAKSAEWTAWSALAFLVLLVWTSLYSLRAVIFFGGIHQAASKLPSFRKAPAAPPAGKKK